MKQPEVERILNLGLLQAGQLGKFHRQQTRAKPMLGLLTRPEISSQRQRGEELTRAHSHGHAIGRPGSLTPDSSIHMFLHPIAAAEGIVRGSWVGRARERVPAQGCATRTARDRIRIAAEGDTLLTLWQALHVQMCITLRG